MRLVLLLAAISCPFLSSCRPNKRYDLIEAELRTRDRELAEARAALDQARGLNRAYDQARPPEFAPAPTAVPAAGGGVCPVREITIGRGTGGLDEDGAPGDEALMVVVVPADEDRSAVKVPGRATVAAWEITPQGLKNPIGTWEIPPEQLRPTWRSGLLASGFFLTLPWQTYPTTDRVRVAVRLSTPDGRAFEADRDVTVRPIAQPGPRGAPLSVPVSPPYPVVPPVPAVGVPTGVEELPPPAGLQPQDRGARLLPPTAR